MKKYIILLLTTLLTTTISFSQSISIEPIVSITHEQLKKTNLIFVEHQKLLGENSLLREQIDNYVTENELLVQTDSLRVSQLKVYEDLSNTCASKVESLNSVIKKKDKTLLAWKVGGITVSACLVLWLLLK